MFLKAKIIVFVFIFLYVCAFAEGAGSVDSSCPEYNVMLITICSLRADHLSCYGYPRNTSPNIDKLAKEGILFENAFSQGTVTLPSLISIHTSLYPQSHGVTAILRDKLPKGIRTLADTLKAYGYKTGLFARLTNPHTLPQTGLGNGFEDIYHFRPEHRPNDRRKAFSWIKRNRKNTFFFSAHLLYLHLPYCPPPKYRQRFVKDYKGNIISSRAELLDIELRLIEQDLKNPDSPVCNLFKEEINSYPDIFQGRMSKRKLDKFNALKNSLPFQADIDFLNAYGEEPIFLRRIDKNNLDDIEHLKDLYDACILRIDDEFIGPLVNKLKALKLYDKTLIIIAGDHGEQFLEHGDLRHGAFYDEIVHIPLIIKMPKDIQYNRNRVNDLVQQIDIMPTVLDVLNRPAFNQAQGISLKYAWADRNIPKGNNYVYAKSEACESIRSKEYKMIHCADDKCYELYDLKSDPQEKNNIYSPGLDVVKRVSDDFVEWKRNLIFYKRDENDSFEKLSEVTKKRIKQTGYW